MGEYGVCMCYHLFCPAAVLGQEQRHFTEFTHFLSSTVNLLSFKPS